MKQVYEGYWLKKGTLLANRYRILNVIGEGGMGNDYLAEDTLLDSKVSIKEYFPMRLATRVSGKTQIRVFTGNSQEVFESGLEKFINEAKLLAKYESIDSIVMVKDFFHENNTAYMVMEHVQGKNIKEIVEKEGPMDPEKVLRIMKPILEALETLHQEKLIHRDISPDNILLRDDGKAVLIDFGAARFSTIQENKTMTVFFKRGYSAEEQYAEKAERGAYTDVYGACATMYFMLTGKKPEESIRRLLDDKIVPLSKYRSINLKIWQKKAIMKGMAVEAPKRYATMEALCNDLYAKKNPSTVKRVVVAGCSVATLALALVLGNHFLQRHTEKDTSHKNPVYAGQKTKNVTEGNNSTSKETDPPVNSTQEPTTTPSPTPTKAPTVKMPKVINMPRKKAEDLIQKKLKYVTIIIEKEKSDKVKKNCVIRQSPKAKKIIKGNGTTEVTLVICSGKKTVSTPSPKPTKKPVATKKPKVTKKPTSTKKPKSTIKSKSAKKKKLDDDYYAADLPW